MNDTSFCSRESVSRHPTASAGAKQNWAIDESIDFDTGEITGLIGNAAATALACFHSPRWPGSRPPLTPTLFVQ